MEGNDVYSLKNIIYMIKILLPIKEQKSSPGCKPMM